MEGGTAMQPSPWRWESIEWLLERLEPNHAALPQPAGCVLCAVCSVLCPFSSLSPWFVDSFALGCGAVECGIIYFSQPKASVQFAVRRLRQRRATKSLQRSVQIKIGTSTVSTVSEDVQLLKRQKEPTTSDGPGHASTSDADQGSG
jgi:hypothetical protein